ncbi:PREDICTED: odorant receptor 13a-like isoform X2 [Dinoponera quadriceps]|uniref:Odorant receptor 13a-like isoform X2 n=1 Tax=Dinoponera quadriceps TaxID=609295 RepID=A0A6P3XXB0_DINQU|nr:PREDICTED: odorant receptor 13a-like isoform X2 [Dinoponera quadriceps]
MDTDWCECVNVQQYLRLMKTKASFSHSCMNAWLSINTIGGLIYFGGNNALALMHLVGNGNNTSRLFPVSVLFPLEAEQSPIYELLVIILFLHAMLVTYTVVFLNALISTLVLHVSGQIDIICQDLQNISENIPYYGSSGQTVGMLIERHNKVITFSKNMDKLFSFMALMQVGWNTLVICFLGLLVVISVHNDTGVVLLRGGFAYCNIMMDVFIFCFAGEYLSHKSRSLGNAGYECSWYKMSPSHSRNILFFIMRSQKQLTITVGGMTNLSLETFTSIMKASASYISVLNAMY